MTDTTSPRIVVVDDTDATRYTLIRMLQKAGFAVREGSTGGEALRLAAEQPDLIILDINLPDASGHDICRQLKEQPDTASIPVLHVSASFVESENRSHGLEVGADGYLTYPVEPRELVAHVNALLRARYAERRIAQLLANERRMAERLRHVAAASLTINTANSMESMLQVVTEEARRILDARQATTSVAEGEDWSRAVHVTSFPEASGPPRSVEPRLEESTLALAVRQGRPMRLTQAELAAHPAWHGDGDPPLGWLAVPLRGRNGRVLGLIQLTDKRDGGFSEEDEHILVQLAQVASVAIENVRLYGALRDNDRLKDEFLAMLAHELRNPLAPIFNAIQVLRLDKSANPQSHRAIDIANRQAQHLARLVDDLMDISRITRGKIKLQQEPLDLATIVSRAVETSRPLIQARRHTFEARLPPDPVHVQGDAVRLSQVLLNLLNNAAKYTPEGGNIRLTVEAVNEQVIIRVRDTGIGIPKEMLSKIFDLFSQVEGTLDRSEGGLGIGLTLVKRLIEMQGGAVEAFSEGPGRGSEFVIRLPRLLTDRTGNGEEASQAPLENTVRKILVVDDNRDSAESLAMLLRLLGHDVRTAHDGFQALAEADAYLPDVVLLDIGLPGLSGYAVAQEVRSRPNLQQTSVIAVSGYASPEDRRRALEAGFSAHLSKPVSLDSLKSLLAQR